MNFIPQNLVRHPPFVLPDSTGDTACDLCGAKVKVNVKVCIKVNVIKVPHVLSYSQLSFHLKRRTQCEIQKVGEVCIRKSGCTLCYV